MKREVVQQRQRSLLKSVMHVQSFCLANLNVFFFDILIAVAVLIR